MANVQGNPIGSKQDSWKTGNATPPNFIHSFHLRVQLEHKYPAEEGGIKL